MEAFNSLKQYHKRTNNVVFFLPILFMYCFSICSFSSPWQPDKCLPASCQKSSSHPQCNRHVELWIYIGYSGNAMFKSLNCDSRYYLPFTSNRRACRPLGSSHKSLFGWTPPLVTSPRTCCWCWNRPGPSSLYHIVWWWCWCDWRHRSRTPSWCDTPEARWDPQWSVFSHLQHSPLPNWLSESIKLVRWSRWQHCRCLPCLFADQSQHCIFSTPIYSYCKRFIPHPPSCLPGCRWWCRVSRGSWRGPWSSWRPCTAPGPRSACSQSTGTSSTRWPRGSPPRPCPCWSPTSPGQGRWRPFLPWGWWWGHTAGPRTGHPSATGWDCPLCRPSRPWPGRAAGELASLSDLWCLAQSTRGLSL